MKRVYPSPQCPPARVGVESVWNMPVPSWRCPSLPPRRRAIIRVNAVDDVSYGVGDRELFIATELESSGLVGRFKYGERPGRARRACWESTTRRVFGDAVGRLVGIQLHELSGGVTISCDLIHDAPSLFTDCIRRAPLPRFPSVLRTKAKTLRHGAFAQSCSLRVGGRC